jgi:hypothetical protein
MEPRDWIAIASIVVSGVVALVSLFINSKREKERQERDDRLRRDQQTREDDIRNRTRLLIPRIEFRLDCNFSGPLNGDYIAEFVLHLINRGATRHQVNDLTMSIRGVKLSNDDKLRFWDDGRVNVPCRVSFPDNLLDKAQVILPGESIAIEPGVTLDMPLSTIVRQPYRYILAKANIDYDKDGRYGVERVFELPAVKS